MKTILKSNDVVYISWVKNLLVSNSISFYVMDEEMSITEGNISAIPVRILVNSDDVTKATEIIDQAKQEL